MLAGVERVARDGIEIGIADPADRSYIESLAPGAERDAVIASVTRYRTPEALVQGDLLPTLTVRSAADLEPVAVADLHDGRPLLLVFGSFT